MRLRLATWNVHGCIGRDARFDPERTLGVLRELDADLVALQELRWSAGAARQMLAFFGEALGCATIAGPTLQRADGHYGNAVLTRLGVREVARIDLSWPGREPRGALDLQLDRRAGGLRVLATHLGLRTAERRAQLRRLLARLDPPGDAPCVLMGDLNEWLPWGRSLRGLRRHFGRTTAPATFPAGWPVFALDRIWVAPQALSQGQRVHASAAARIASDHLPLVAELEVPIER